MKQIKTILAALSILTVVSSCKKDAEVTAPPATSTNTRLVKIAYEGTNEVQQFKYNAEGRISEITGNGFISKYSYTGSAVVLEIFKANNSKFVDCTNIVFDNNKIASFDFRLYNSTTGLPGSADPNVFQYDANGYLVKKSYTGYVYDFTIANGNTVNMKQTAASGATDNTVLEYYTDKPNKLNINLMENWYLDQYIFDKDLQGRKSVNLPKKISNAGAVTELSYTMNAQGLPAQIVIKYTPVATGVTKITTANLTYQ